MNNTNDINEILNLTRSIKYIGGADYVLHYTKDWFCEETYPTTRIELDHANPNIGVALDKLLHFPHLPNSIDMHLVDANIRMGDNPVLLETRSNALVYVAGLSKIRVQKNMLSLSGELYEVSVKKVKDNPRSPTLAATRRLINDFNININLVEDQFPGFKQRLAVQTALDLPDNEWVGYLFGTATGPVLNQSVLPDDLTQGF